MKWPLLQDHQLACSWAGILSLHCQCSFSNSISTSPILGQAVENLGGKKRKEKQTEWKVMVKLWGPLTSVTAAEIRKQRRRQKSLLLELILTPNPENQLVSVAKLSHSIIQMLCCDWVTYCMCWLSDWLSESTGVLMVQGPLANPQDAQEKKKFKVIAEWATASHH